MPVVQATISFVVEMREFHNVDLYHRGYYQIRTYFKTNGLTLTGASPVVGKQVAAVLVEPPLLWERTSTRRVVPESIRGSYIDPGSNTPNLVPEKACSKTLLIMYREESTKLCDVFEQRVLFPVDPCNLEDSLVKHELFLCVELWFAEEGIDESNVLQSLEKVHERQLRVHFSPTRGLHNHFDVFFDYFHLCAVEMAIHGALTNITPSVISPPKQSPRATPMQHSVSQLNLTQQSWHSILFSMRNHTSRVQLAFAVHRHLCHALLAARESMLLFWREVLPYLSANTKPRMEPINFQNKLDGLVEVVQAQPTDEDLANQISLDISRLSSQNTVLLRQLGKSCVLQPKVAAYLRRKAHQLRVKRFAEAFFCQELSLVHLLAVYDPNTVGHEALAADVRQSPYFQQLPALPVSCRELDGDTATLPIIFEDVFLSPVVHDSKGHYPNGSAADPVSVKLSQASPPARGDSPVELTKMDIKQTNGVSNVTRGDYDGSKVHKHHKQSNLERGTFSYEMKHFSKSSPALPELGLPRVSINLPPVLRYIGQNRRRLRRSSYHGHRSIRLIRPRGPSVIVDPINQGSVKLLGYRSLIADEDPVDNPLLMLNSDTPIPRPPLPASRFSGSHLTDVSSSTRLCRTRSALASRDLRTRSIHSLTSSITLLNVNSDAAQRGVTHISPLSLSSSNGSHEYPIPDSCTALKLTASHDHLAVACTPSRSSGAETDRSVVLPLNSVTDHQTKASTVAAPANLNNAHTQLVLRSPTHPRLFWRTHERYHPRPVALGTLSRPPLDPPGGCVPRARLSDGLDLFSFTNLCGDMSTASTTRLQTNGLSVSLSLPNLLPTRSLARVSSDSVLESSSPAKKYQTAKRLDRKLRNRSGRNPKPGSRHSNSGVCRTYTPDLAYLGSCSDLGSTLLAESYHLRNNTAYRPYSSSQQHLSSSGRPVSRSTSVICPKSSARDTISPLRRSADSDVPNAGNSDLENSELEPRTSGNRNNAGRWINRCWSSTGQRRSSEWRMSNSSGSSPVDDVEQNDLTQPLGSVTTHSSTVGHASIPMLSLHVDPAVDGDVHRGFRVNSVSRPDQTGSDLTGSLSVVGLTVKSLSENRLMEYGYQVLENDLSDDDVVASDELKQEKLSILELLRQEAKRYDSYENVILTLLRLAMRRAGRVVELDTTDPNVLSESPTVNSYSIRFKAQTDSLTGLNYIMRPHHESGNSSDLRLVRVYLQLALPDCRLEFLMSECNQSDTFAGFDSMRDNLAEELITFINELDETPDRISFIGHSMGCVLVRALLLSPLLKPYLSKLHTFLSLSGPHLGTVYNSSGLVNMGMWVMQKWKKSESLAQLRLRDEPNLRQTYMYRLNASPGLDLFRYVLLVSSPQDRYVPYHSTRIELCRAAVRDNSPLSIIYMEMVTNVLQRLIKSTRTTVVRYDVHYSFGSSANNLIGRAAHIAVLDSEIFLEKFICVSAAKYFR
ncbi:uncharacterized protein DEA37_0004229 [Paragonimus westermani]|uniref:DUF676 domain-containing protein n=1 Tax=Paragonimus westermani TaxID=34504 RepID=A0A5J4P3G3_9TREM|nr:uncharacterized protein DEA37_0004229 [Paragonimus westermani]